MGQIRLQMPNVLLIPPAIICFLEGAREPLRQIFTVSGDPLPLEIAFLGSLLVGRSLWSKRLPVPVVVSGYVLTAVSVGMDRGVIADNFGWAAVVLAGFACFGWWRKVERIWKRDE